MSLNVQQLSIGFHRYDGLLGSHFLPVLQDISLDVATGTITGLVGESGSGKSLIATALMGGLPDSAEVRGQMMLDDQPLLGTIPGGWRQGRLALVPQGIDALDPMASVGHQLIRFGRLAGLGRQSARQRANTLLAEQGLEGLWTQRPYTLSGGMARRVLTVAALMSGAQHLIFDEPTVGLDPARARDMLAMIRGLADQGRACLVISHDLVLLANSADDIVVLREGRHIETAPAACFRHLAKPGAEPGLKTATARALWLAQPAIRRSAGGV